MSDGLDVIIIDDDKGICEIIKELVESFYDWGDVISFSNADKAIDYCLQREVGVAIFIIDVFLGGLSGFYFLDAIEKKYPTAHQDAIIISGNASDDVVNILDTNRYPHKIRADTGSRQLISIQLSVSGRGRVTGQ